MTLNSLFYPKSIAIIGASSREKTVGNDVVKNLVEQGYQGKILPVNPKISELYGQKVYADVSGVDQEIELVVVAIPAKFVPANIELAASKGAKAAIVISAGFKETGEVELEQELQAVCAKHNIALVGPNCLGVINPEIQLNASFAQLMPELGEVAFISQSGALCTAILDYAQKLGVGFSKFISIGNKADVDELQLVRYFAEDKQTRVVMIYAEELTNAPEFISTLRQLNRGDNPKPIIILKSGRTEAGAGAIASHTGSLAGGDAAYTALFKQAGLIRANSIKELFDLAQVFSKNQLQPAKRYAIVTNAGGPGVLTTDEATDNGLEMAQLSQDSITKLKAALPQAASANNPVDVLGDAKADRYELALQVLAEDEQVDSIQVIMTPQSMTEIEATAKAAVSIKQQTNKPIVVSLMGEATVQPGVKLLHQHQVASTNYPEPGAKGLAKLDQFYHWTKQTSEPPLAYNDVDQQKVAEIFAKARETGQTSFPEAEAMEIIKAYNFPILQSEVARSPQEARQLAQKIGTKLAMKIVSPDILHKSDVGGVILNVTEDDVEAKYQEMMQTVAGHKPEAKLEGVLLMEMAPADGLEVILGVNQAPGLGTMIMFGLGGVYVEVLKDVAFAYAPLTKTDALAMIEDLKTAELFEGVRGEAPRDKEKLVECLGRLSQLVTDFPQISELDINPLLSLPQGQGAKVLDVRIVIAA